MDFQPWQFYIVVGFLCLTAEIVTPSFFLAPIGVAALVTAGLSVFVTSLTVQFVVMALTALFLYFTLTPFARARFNRAPPPSGVGLVGQVGTLKEICISSEKPGKVFVYGDTWDVLWNDSDETYISVLRTLQPGCRIRIKQVVGNRVIIEPV